MVVPSGQPLASPPWSCRGGGWHLQRGAVVVGALRVDPCGASPHPCCLRGHTKVGLPQSFGENVSLGELASSSFIPEFFWFSFLVPFIPGHREEPHCVGWKCLQGFLPFHSSVLKGHMGSQQQTRSVTVTSLTLTSAYHRYILNHTFFPKYKMLPGFRC